MLYPNPLHQVFFSKLVSFVQNLVQYYWREIKKRKNFVPSRQMKFNTKKLGNDINSEIVVVRFLNRRVFENFRSFTFFIEVISLENNLFCRSPKNH